MLKKDMVLMIVVIKLVNNPLKINQIKINLELLHLKEMVKHVSKSVSLQIKNVLFILIKSILMVIIGIMKV